MKERAAGGEKITDNSWLFRSYAVTQVRAGKMVAVKVKKDMTGPRCHHHPYVHAWL
jgi:hypothetical protein